MAKKQRIVAPSLLSADFANLARDVQAVTQAGAEWLHLDVMDGHFVPNLTMGPAVAASLRKSTQLYLDAHLMVVRPGDWIDPFHQAGVNGLTLHVESEGDIRALLRKIKSLGMVPGITLRPRTDLSEIFPYMEEVGLVLIMTVEPGFSGQSFMRDQADRVGLVKKFMKEKGLSALVEVDGGVNDKTLEFVSEADVLVSGNYIFKNDMAEAIQRLKG